MKNTHYHSSVQSSQLDKRRPQWRDSEFLRIGDVAEHLGISRTSVYNLEAAGQIEFVNLPDIKRRLVKTASVLALASRAKKSSPNGANPRGATLARKRTAA